LNVKSLSSVCNHLDRVMIADRLPYSGEGERSLHRGSIVSNIFTDVDLEDARLE
jgi:hypothetical protein